MDYYRSKRVVVRRSTVTLLLMLFTVAPLWPSTPPKRCTYAEQIAVEKEAVNLRTWDALYNSFRRYRHCDDVDAEEGYSESVARVLADHWETLPRLGELAKKDKDFAQWVGLDATMDMDDVAKIKQLALTKCPANMSRVCAKLIHDADEAIAEDASYQRDGKQDKTASH